MSTQIELANQIRFSLEQLAIRNAHHDFESLCRHLARAKICRNILPATGPVSGGGDQGRDFETFRSYLADNFGHGAFVGVTTSEAIAFACTIQKDGIDKKARRDVTKIAESGNAVDAVYFMCSTDIPAARRHKLQEWCTIEHQIHLEILDGQAITEALTDKDTFWIASQYLHIPSEVFPSISLDGEGWYGSKRSLWEGRSSWPLTHASFSDLKLCLRQAAVEERLISDVPMWIRHIERFIEEEPITPLKLRAIYETSVASLQTFHSLENLEPRIRLYFDETIHHLGDLPRLGDVEDASVLMIYCLGSVPAHASTFTFAEVMNWRGSILSHIDFRISISETNSTKCELMRMKGYILAVSQIAGQKLAEEDCLDVWLEMAGMAFSAPLFRLDSFVDFFHSIISRFDDFAKVRELSERLDDLVALRMGQAAVAAKARDRAIIFFKGDQLLRSVEEFHSAKIKWFSQETLHGSILATILLSQCYLGLGLVYAAKYYALLSSWLAIESPDSKSNRLASRGLFIASDIEFKETNWSASAHLADLAVKLHWEFASEAFEEPFDELINLVLNQVSYVHAVSKYLADDTPTLELEARFYSWGGVGAEALEISKKIQDDAISADPDSSKNDLLQVYGVSISNTAACRLCNFSCWGVSWQFSWERLYGATSAAEEFISFLQIILADLDDTDLSILPTQMSVAIGFVSTPEEVNCKFSLDDGVWHVSLLATQMDERERSEKQSSLMGIIFTLLRDVSLLKHETLVTVMDRLAFNGIFQKALTGASYSFLYEAIYLSDSLNRLSQIDLVTRTSATIAESLTDELLWPNGLLDDYSEEESLKAIKNRYKNTLEEIPVTIVRLSQDVVFQESLVALRSEGWKDWHILMAIANIFWNYHIDRRMPISTQTRMADSSRQAIVRSIRDDKNLDATSSIPIGEFGLEGLRRFLLIGMPSTLHTWSLGLYQISVDFDALTKLMRERLNYFRDDVSHQDPFTPSSSPFFFPEDSIIS